MANCTPCSTGSDMSECCPTLIEAGKYVEVNDAFCNARTLEGRKNALLFHGSGKNPVKWSDGSDARPITLDQLAQLTNNGFQSIVITDSAGRVYRSVPDPLLGKQEIYYEGGAISWKPYGTNRHSFPNGQILQKEPSSPVLAAFDPCGPDGQTVLYKLPQGYIESLIPMPESFSLIELARNICANAKAAEDLTPAQLASLQKLSIICDENTAAGFPTIVLGEVESTVGAAVQYFTAAAITVYGTYTSLAPMAVYDGGSLGISTIAGGVVTVLSAGQYKFDFQANCDHQGSGGAVYIKPFINGIDSGLPEQYVYVSPAAASGSISYCFSKTLAANDTVEFRGYGDNASTVWQNMLTVLKLG